MKEKKKKIFTIMIIPHSDRDTLAFNIPLVAVQAIGLGMIIGIAAVVVFAFSYQNVKHKMETYRDGFSEYTSLRDQVDYFAKKTDDLQQKMKTLEQLDREIRTILKNDPAVSKINKQGTRPSDATAASRGTEYGSNRFVSARENMLRSLETMEQQMVERQQSLEEVKGAILERQARLNATPSIWPVKNPRITSHFGYRRSPYSRRIEFHHGMDMATYYGAPVYAAHEGKVTFAGWRAGYGRTVVISNRFGFTTLYGHASQLLVKTGETVKKGQVIANVGNSGRSTGSHLHYEVMVNGQLKNPKDYLP